MMPSLFSRTGLKRYAAGARRKVRFGTVGLIGLLSIILAAYAGSVADPRDGSNQIVLTVHDDVLHDVDARLFGHFLERPSWGGEIGIEGAIDEETGQLREDVRALLLDMEIPILRFPGGTDVELMDWLDMIDNAPGREGGRPLSLGRANDYVSNRFGIDEALQLNEEIGSEMILVVNFFGDCFDGDRTREDAARHAAGLIAYVNGRVGESLPAGMYDWPSLRASNGRHEPYGVRFVQIANEPWVHTRELVRLGTIPEDLKQRYFECMDLYIDAIREVDPDIEIIVDGNSEELIGPTRAHLGDRVAYAAYHVYQPWGIAEVFRNGEAVDPLSLSDEEIWKAWVATPEMDEQGRAVLSNPIYRNARASGYPVAVTEWNWNGWWMLPDEEEGQRMSVPKMAQGLGAAGFLHAMLREGDHIKIGIQSMLVGQSWDITGIRVDTLDQTPPHYYPTAQVVDLYARHHGSQLLRVTERGVPTYEQPFHMSRLLPKESVAMIDAVATRSDESVFVHIINRNYSDDLDVRLDLSEFANLGERGTISAFTGSFHNSPASSDRPEIGAVESRPLTRDGAVVDVRIPAQSVSVIEFPHP
jgi:alpha-L-arabinofuranosidase